MGFGAATDDRLREERIVVPGPKTGSSSTGYGRGWWTAGAVIVIAIVALGVRLYQLSGRSLWLDEILTAQPARLSGPGEVIAWSQAAINQMPLYYFFVWLLGRWGDSEFILRLPSAVAGASAVVAVYLLGRRLFGNRTGLVAALLTAILPYAVWYSQEARNYSLFMLLTTAQMYFAITALKRGRVIDWIGLGVFTTLNLYTHYLALATTAAVFVLVGGVLASDLLRSSSFRLRVILVSALVLLSGAVAVIPWRTLLRVVYVDASDSLVQTRPIRLPVIAGAAVGLIALAFLARLLERQRQSVKLAVASLLLILLATVILAAWVLGGFASRPLPLQYGAAIVTVAAAFGVASLLLLRAAVTATPGAARRLDLALVTGSLVILAYAPWLPTLRIFLSQPGQSLGVTYSGGEPGFSDLVAQLAGLGLSGPTLIAFLIGLVVVGVRFFKGRPLESTLLVLWLSVPILLLWLSVHAAILGIDNRYLNFLFPAAMIVSAAGIDGVARALEQFARRGAAGLRLDGRRLGLAASIVLVGLTMVQAVAALASSYGVPKHDYRGATEHIARSSPANSVVLALGTYSWTSAYFAFRAPPHASSVTMILRAHGKGDAEFRALQLGAISDQP
jgi:uncharacterized membrane protein